MEKAKLISRLLVGSTAALFVYTDMPDDFISKSLNKLGKFKTEYSSKYGQGAHLIETQDKVNDILDEKIRILYTKQQMLRKNLKDANKTLGAYQNKANSYEVRFNEQVRESKSIRASLENKLDAFEKKILVVPPAAPDCLRVVLPYKASSDDVFKWN